MMRAGRMMKVADEMTKFKIELIALQEIRWHGSGKIEKKDFSVLYSGPEYRTGQGGVGFMIGKKLKSSILGFYPAGSRLCRIRIKGKFRNISIVSVYAPTEEGDENEKDSFYEALERECRMVPKHDMLIVIGDLNAQIGKEDFLNTVAGKCTIHDVTNENG
ncbi:craniofacial development protein 2-like [Nilaparvata lugens]|uniref:craniofacial development protein 2-like n=1 Tax=Nilaparvata lugens TaxID=108931 RepID=UPI00193E8321|nr:craniofacial development protein 2-like [Nilaparvata lugens]